MTAKYIPATDKVCERYGGEGWIWVPGLPGCTVGDRYPDDPDHWERCPECNQSTAAETLSSAERGGHENV